VITYWTPTGGSFTVANYLQVRGKPIADRFTICPYDDLTEAPHLVGGAQIFSAIDQLTPTGNTLVGELWDRVAEAAPCWARLNDPRRVLLRQPFLEAMAACGLNSFRVFPAIAAPPSLRYPVFLRERDRHNGPLTGLLDSAAAVQRALRALRLRGNRVTDLLIVEYVHTADGAGHFRKYSAYRVGAAIVRTHLMTGGEWSVKSGTNTPTVELASEESDYLHGDAHEAWLRQTFELSRIDFGRIDYGVFDGQPQAWEINMNPTIGRQPDKPPTPVSAEIKEIREAARIHAHRLLREAFVALDSAPASPPSVSVALPTGLVRAVQREMTVARRRVQAVTALQRAFHSPLGWPVRAVYGRLFRRM
ncbi:MAG TPA: hypothetical protein VMK53_10350, partial [Gemmatimonadales bacterium]|nr:hypothetical protein [Gemmatimonadales bacterium]